MVMPLKDILERRTFPLVNIVLIVLNVVFFIYELSLGERLEGFLRSAAFVPATYFEPGNAVADAKSVLLSMFLHGGWMHVGGNMLYLWIFGDNVEDRFGHIQYVFFYLFCGWMATLAHGWFNPGSAVPSIGASGAISGVLGAYIVLFPHARVLTLVPMGFYMRMATLPAIVVLGLWFVIQAFSGLADLGARAAQTAGVAWWAHIGGFAAGAIIALVVRGVRRDTAPRAPAPWGR